MAGFDTKHGAQPASPAAVRRDAKLNRLISDTAFLSTLSSGSPTPIYAYTSFLNDELRQQCFYLISVTNMVPAHRENAVSNPSRWVLVKRFAEVTGYSENAVRHKVKGGIWLEGRIWRKAPDGRIFLNLAEFERWVESTAHARSF